MRWTGAVRIIATRFPPIPLFERIADATEHDLLAEVESLTNPRVRDLLGEAPVVEDEDRVTEPGSAYVMAPFAHPRPSRFSDGSFGVFYCARRRLTAVHETAYHMGRFYAATAEPPIDFDMRELVGRVDHRFHDLRDARARRAGLFDPDDYGRSQAFGGELRARGSHGVVYPSVRHTGGTCLGAFRPRAVGIPEPRGVLTYRWNGTRVDRWFDHASETWHELA